MCIIAVIPKGVAPDYKYLENCFDYNNHGAGYAFQTERGIMIEKGFFKFERFFGHLAAVGNDVDRVCHFRLATSGLIDQGNCHPFPVSKSFDQMRKPRIHTDVAIAHNGIITKCTPPSKSMWSDTMQFIRDYLYQFPRDFYNNAAICDMVDWSTANKFAILWREGYRLIGTFNLAKGTYYSNYSWQDNVVTNYYYDRTNKEKYIMFDLKEVSEEKFEDVVTGIIETLDADYCIVSDYFHDEQILWIAVNWYPTRPKVSGYTWLVDQSAPTNETVSAGYQTTTASASTPATIVNNVVTSIKEINGVPCKIVKLLDDKGEALDAYCG